MAAPTLVGQSAIVAITTGNLTATIPTHQTNDILIVATICWLPNSSGAITAAIEPSGWTRIIQQSLNTTAPSTRGHIDVYWKRATSAAETFSQTRPTPSWDTGTDGVWAARAYVIRGCVTTGNPYDAVAEHASDTANGTFPAVTVSGSERTVVQFWMAPDNTTISGAVSGWTAGTQLTSATGTDSGFGVWYKENVSASTSADATTNANPATASAPKWDYVGISFKPPSTATIQGSWGMIKAK